VFIRKIHASAGYYNAAKRTIPAGASISPLSRCPGRPGHREAARTRRSRIWRVPVGGTEYVGITWAVHSQCRAADCDCGRAPAAYRPRHAASSRWPARLAGTCADALRRGRNVLAMLADAWPGLARGPGTGSTAHSRLRASARARRPFAAGPEARLDRRVCPAPDRRHGMDGITASSGDELRARCAAARAAATVAVERSSALQQQLQETLQQVTKARAEMDARATRSGRRLQRAALQPCPPRVRPSAPLRPALPAAVPEPVAANQRCT
jgi:hypothetical protein